MCVTSMVMDHFRERWEPYTVQPIFWPPNTPGVRDPRITDDDLAQFRKLLERAKKYDKEHDEPDCELDEKRKKIKELADKLGVDVSFV